MTDFTPLPTVVSGNAWSPAQHNTFVRDNFAVLFPHLAIGDLAFAANTPATRLSILSKPSSLKVLTMDSSGVPAWATWADLPGALHKKGQVNFAPAQDFNGSWANITGATITLDLAVTCTVVFTATVVGRNHTAGNGFIVRGVADGVADPSPVAFNGGQSIDRDETLDYIWMATGVGAGSKVFTLQCEQQGTTNRVTQGRLEVEAHAE